jgi:antitoxin FitA
MPVLHLDNVPEELYGRIEQLAAAEQIPVTEATLRLLRQAVEGSRPNFRASVLPLLEEMRRNRITPAAGTPDSVDLLREDRCR